MPSLSSEREQMEKEKEECTAQLPQMAFSHPVQEFITSRFDPLLNSAIFKVKEPTCDGTAIKAYMFIVMQEQPVIEIIQQKLTQSKFGDKSLGEAVAKGEQMKKSTYSSYKITIPYDCSRVIKLYVHLFLRIDNKLPVQDTAPTVADVCVPVFKHPGKRSYDDCETCMNKPIHCQFEETFSDQDISKKEGTVVHAPSVIYADEDDAEPMVNLVPYSSIESNANDVGPSSMDSDTPQDSQATNNGPPQGQQASNGSGGGGGGGRGNDRDGSSAGGRGGGNGSGDGRPPPRNRTTAGSPGEVSGQPNRTDEDGEEELDRYAGDAATDPEKQTATNCTDEIQGHGINENSDSSQSSTKYESSDDSVPQVEPCDDPPPSGNSLISDSNTDGHDELGSEINMNFIIMLLYCFLCTLLEARRYCQLFLRSLCFLLWIYLFTARTRLPCDTHRPQSALRRHQPVCRSREAFGFLMSQRIRRYLEDGNRSQLLWNKIQKRRKGPRRLRLHVSSARSRHRGWWAAPGRNPSSTPVGSDWHETTGIQCFDDILSGRGTFYPDPRPGNLEEPGAQGNDDGMENPFPLPVLRPPGPRLRRNISLRAVCEEDVEEQNENQLLQDNEEDVQDFSLRPEMQLRHGLVVIDDDQPDWQNEGEFDDMGENMVFSLERRLQLQQRSGDIILGAEGTVQDTQSPPTDQQGLENCHDHSVSQGERNQPGENAEGAVGGEAGSGPDKDRCVRCRAPVPKERVHQCGRAYCYDCIRALSAPPSVQPKSGCPHCG